jgi:hypothetical protein
MKKLLFLILIVLASSCKKDAPLEKCDTSRLSNYGKEVLTYGFNYYGLWRNDDSTVSRFRLWTEKELTICEVINQIK